MRENFAEEGGRLVTRERETHKQGSILLMWGKNYLRTGTGFNLSSNTMIRRK